MNFNIIYIITIFNEKIAVLKTFEEIHMAKVVFIESERESIKFYNQGQGLFICGNRRMRIQVVATQEELDSLGSGGGL